MTGTGRRFGRRTADRSVDRPSGVLNTFEYPKPRSDLDALSLIDLSTELLARLARGETFERDKDLVIAGQIQDLLESRLNVHLNRFSRRRLYDVVRPVLDQLPPAEFRGGTIVDLGCGSLNPFVFAFTFLMLGAERAYAIDLEPVQNLERAIRALAAAASWLLVNPESVVGHHALPATSTIGHLGGFDLAKLAAGNPDGVGADRLVYSLESVYDLSLEDGEADLVSSVSLLEHLDRLGDAIINLHRITKPGGLGHHIVDFIDHDIYGGHVTSPFEFLKINTSDPLVHGSNRLRCSQVSALFERHGFAVERVDPSRREPLDDKEQRQFAEPYRSMNRDDLMTVCARIVVRRR